MALLAVKTFIAGEVLFASDVNALNTNILNNATDLVSPFTKAISMGGFALNFDAANTMSMTYSAKGINLSLTTAINDAKTTVISAASPDIWTACGRLIDYTGTVAATSFPNAPQAGAVRELLCAAAAPFTTGTNFVVAGGSFTATAGDRILVVAETTTKFRLYPLKADGTAVISTAVVKNYAVNGSFAVNQIVTPTTTDNSYPIDGWRLLLGAANAATISQDTADVPTGAGFALKLVVGSGNNNKFGVFCPIENKDILDLRGGFCSIRVPLKATAGLVDGTGQIRIGIMQWTSTADSISATPIAAWGAEGTNPTPIANWTFLNTPVAIPVTTSWADYTVIAAAVSASATNLGLFIWSDDKTNTQTTDILRIGGYITLGSGSSAPVATVAPFDAELRKCQRYFCKTFALSVAPAQNTSNYAGVVSYFSQAAVLGGLKWYFPLPMRIVPTVTTYSPGEATANWWDAGNSTGRAVAVSTDSATPGDSGVTITSTAFLTGTRNYIHAVADARL